MCFILLIGQHDAAIEPLIREFHIVTVSILLEALPFIIFGSLVSGMIEVFLSKDRIAKLVPKNKAAAVSLAALLGIIFPICECGIIPVVRRLSRKGVPFFFAITYMLAAPIINPVVIASTLVAYKGSQDILFITAGRICGGFFIPVCIGLIASYIFKNTDVVITEDAGEDHDHSCCTHDDDGKHLTFPGKIVSVFKHASDDLFDIGRFLILGAFIAGMLRSISIPSGNGNIRLIDMIVGGEIRQIFAMMLLAVLLSLCSEADAFFSRAFSVSLVARLGFLVLGPMFDIKLFVMYFKVFKKKLILYLAVSIVLANSIVWFLVSLFMKGA